MAREKKPVLIHWRRPLKDGRIEVYARVDNEKLHARVTPDALTNVITMFEAVNRCELPEPEWRPALFKGLPLNADGQIEGQMDIETALEEVGSRA